jgi:lysozyme family protein
LPVSHDIKWLQGILQNPLYGYHGDIDGIIGPLTEAAMIKYAETHEIS